MAVVHFSTIPCEPDTARKVQRKPHFRSIRPGAIDIVSFSYGVLEKGVGTSFLITCPHSRLPSQLSLKTGGVLTRGKDGSGD